MNIKNIRRARFVALAAASSLLFAGCSTAAPETAAAPAGESVTMSDAWVKAADSGMSAAFGELENTSDHDVTVVSVQTPASTMNELHETVENDAGEMVMQEVEGGFTIAAGETLALEPGANHFMLMDLAEPLKAGDVVSFTITFSDDSTYEFEAPVKDYSGANETYEGDSHGDMHGDGAHGDEGDHGGEQGDEHEGMDH